MVKPQVFTEIYGTRPVWMGDEYKYENLITNGAILRPGSVPAGMNIIPSGQLVGRGANQKQFIYIAPAAVKTGGYFLTRNETTLAADVATGATVIPVRDIDGFYNGLSINVGGNTNTILSVNPFTSSLTLTAGIAAGVAAGGVVRYAAAENITELFVTATEIVDVGANSEFTQYRQGRLIYINFLPGYADFSADVRNSIKALYHTILAIA